MSLAPRTASPNSKAVATLRSLAKKRNRDESGLAVAEGPSAVEYAVRAGALQSLFCDDVALAKFAELIEAAEAVGTEVLRLDDGDLARVADTQTPQGLIGMATCPLRAGIPTVSDLTILLDAVQDPGNVGTIIRNADAFGAAVVVGPGTADPRSAKVVRSSAGSVFGTDLFVSEDAVASALALRDRGVEVVAASVDGSTKFFTEGDSGESQPIGWVLGNEASGVSAALADACSSRGAIPMVGTAESLNVAAAAAICLYESRRKLG